MLPILFQSTDQGAPQLTHAAGSVISIFDACLVTGYNTLGVTVLSVAGNVATATTSTNHGLKVKDRVTLSGIGISAANGDKEVLSIVDNTKFTFACVTSNATDNPVGGSCKRTPLGWVKEFSKTNVAMYKMTDVAAYGQRLRVDDTTIDATNACRVIGVENPTGIDTYTDIFPLQTQISGGLYWARGFNALTSRNKYWCIVGDERGFYWVTEDSYTNRASPTAAQQQFFVHYFGDINSIRPGEAYGTVICGSASGINSNSFNTGLHFSSAAGVSPSTTYNMFIARQFTGVAKSIRCLLNQGAYNGYLNQSNSPLYPSPVDNGMIFTEFTILSEQLAWANHPIRGYFPGIVQGMCRNDDLPDSATVLRVSATDTSGLEVAQFKNCVPQSPSSISSSAAFFLKLNAPWRS